MNQLQIILDALDNGLPEARKEAMEIVKQMMRAEPVVTLREGDSDIIPAGTKLYTHSAPQAVPAWLPISSAPKDGTLVVLYSPNGPDDWPDSFKVTFDYFCEDYGNWFHHSEAYEHYMAVGGSNACGPDAVCIGPSEKAPYTHWMPLPAAPKEET